ncbi:MAG: TetR family transcriptional regulator [Microbacterium sp. 69-10]|uniref:TetR/AcrR family transcriptional regulator n=1 Tax=Microbacterium sp. 69-10 TaxID=1895783 RepID=UPI000960864C|nr:TetR/AcrR family transcriptional regulator [Microbacterium sp. 69-10]OJU39945.1 MAG: TetR family transcriptional regulator [Microbacterium sp. 69-10]
MLTQHQTGAAAGTGSIIDARAQRSRATVLAAATELLESTGVGGFSVDEVARRSGVAKTTIYRHWPTREALVLDACAGLDDRYDLPDTGTLRGDVGAFVADLVHMVTRASWASVLPSIVDAAERNAAFADMHAQIQKGHASLIAQIAERAIGRGELPAGTDTALLASTVMGPVFYRRWFSREPLDAAFIDAVTDRAIRGVQGCD